MFEWCSMTSLGHYRALRCVLDSPIVVPTQLDSNMTLHFSTQALPCNFIPKKVLALFKPNMALHCTNQTWHCTVLTKHGIACLQKYKGPYTIYPNSDPEIINLTNTLHPSK
jgi:hypothetical protein